MTQTKFSLIFSCLKVGLFFITALPLHAQRTELNVNDAWYFHHGDHAEATLKDFDHNGWMPVRLPHTWNDKDVLADGQRGYYRGVCWYRRHLCIPDDGNRRYLHFEGANQVSTLFVNGREVGTHVGGYTAFTFDLTDYLEPGVNVLAVKVDNSHDASIPPLSADFTFFGGIYRNVRLITTSHVHVDLSDHGSMGVFIDCPELNDEQADVRIRGRIAVHKDNSKQLKVLSTFHDAAYKEVHQLSAMVQPGNEPFVDFLLEQKGIKGFALWSPSQPHLYTVHTAVYEGEALLDEVYNSFGFRWFHFDAAKGFFLNGEPLKLLGANRHQDRWGIGNALSDDMHRKDMQLLKELGANFLRTAHYPQSRAVLEAADRMGIIVWEEIPLVNEVGLNAAFAENAKTMLREMVRQHYNHPSIAIWAYMNEIYWMHRFVPEHELPERNEYTLQLAQSLEQMLRQEDATRYTAMAVHNYPLYEQSGILDIPKIIGWNLYHGWYYDSLPDFGKFMDAQHAAHPERLLMVSEFGAGGDVRLSSHAPERFDFSNEGQLDFMAGFLSQIKERPYIAGASVWNLVDFSSERRVDAISHLNSKGLLTADRQAKDAYYLTQCFMSDEPQLRLGHNHQDQLYYQAISHSDSLWKGEIRAFTNAAKCSLFVDDRYVGEATSEACTAKWNVELKPGTCQFCVQADGLKHCATKELRHVPYRLPANVDLALNLGAAQTFFDPLTDLTWLPTPDYQKGSYGFIGGQKLYVQGKLGTKEDILTTEHLDPLYQSMMEGISAVRFDVPDGRYEVELLMVDYVPYGRRFADVDNEVQRSPGKRIFHVDANGVRMLHNLDLGGDYGLNMPVQLTFNVVARDGQGVKLDFVKARGEPLLSAVRIRGLQGQ